MQNINIATTVNPNAPDLKISFILYSVLNSKTLFFFKSHIKTKKPPKKAVFFILIEIKIMLDARVLINRSLF